MAKRPRRRRIWTDDEKRMICRQARLPGVSVSQVARRYDVNANLVFKWLRDARLAPEDAEAPIEASAVERDPATSSAASPMTFLAVEMIDEAAGPASPDAPMEAPPAGTMEIALAGGHRLRIVGAYDPDALARFLRGLSE